MASRAPAAVAPRAVERLRREALPFERSPAEVGPLFDRIGDARVVLLGEATHGTHEFYVQRAEITKRLLAERGFRAVAVEGDWPDAFRVNRFVRGASGGTPAQALEGFGRFPAWMWRNADVLDFVGWLRTTNQGRPARERAGFYGLDLYSLYASIGAVLRYLDQVDPDAARRARERYACFERFREDAQAYGYAAAFGLARSCEDDVVGQLREMHASSVEYVARDGRFDPDDHFHAEQNARLVRDAERYYREMYKGRVSSWNLRDRHMMDTLEALLEHLAGTGPSPVRVVVWAHNSHVGDARATEMGETGEWNVGQLARERFGDEAVLIGFTTHRGTVSAAGAWDEPARRRAVRPALEGSYESLFHAAGIPRFVLLSPREPLVPEPLLERAIGVVYRPETERESHYFEAHLHRQFDAVVHTDETRAVEPLEPGPGWAEGEPPETYPSGL